MSASSAWVGYRIAPSRAHVVRPPWFSQRKCMESFLRSVRQAEAEGSRIAVHWFVDGLDDADLLDALSSTGTVHLLDSRGNSRSFREVLAAAVLERESPNVLLVEDDYVWRAGAVSELLSAVDSRERGIYFSPYAHPRRIRNDKPDVRRHRTRTVAAPFGHWVSTPQTTMTFACRRDTLEKDASVWKLASYGDAPKDGYAFVAINEGRWLRLVGNAGYRDLRRILNLEAVGEMVRLTLRLLRPGRKPRLYQAEPGLACHIHIPYISSDHDWEAESGRE